MKKFWNKSADSNDIYIYGDIVSERWDEAEVTAKSFLDDLKSCKGKSVNLHVNSSGGDVFTALAIHNSLKNYKGGVNVYVDGLAASAASLIICAGDVVKMASNALIMVHSPSVGLMGYYNAAELEKTRTALMAVESSILDTYKQRLPKKNHTQISQMVTAETWLTAEEAQELGFVDEITGAVEMEVDDAKRLLVVNKLEIDCKNFGEKFSALMAAQGVKKMENKVEVPASETSDVKQANELLIKDAIAQARAQEVQRIKNLSALKSGVVEVDAVIDVAILEGAEVADVTKYVDAIKNAQKKNPAPSAGNIAIDAITAAIRDNLRSGAENVTGSVPSTATEDKRAAQAKAIAEIANSLRGVKKNG